MSSGGVLTVLT